MARKNVNWEQIKNYYIGLKNVVRTRAIAATAEKFGLARPTVSRRAKEYDWESERNDPDLIPLNSSRPVRSSPTVGNKDRLTMVQDAIEGISVALAAMSYKELRSASGGANALCKLIELERKMLPSTAVDLAKAAIDAGISPEEFIKALADEWPKQA